MPFTNQFRASATKAIAVTMAILLSATRINAQGTLAQDPVEVHQRLLEVLGRRTPTNVGGWNVPRGLGSDTADSADPWAARRLPAPRSLFSKHLQVQVLPIDLRVSHNSHRPWGINDGPVWQGRGLTTSLSGGLTLRWGPIEATARPIVWRSGNENFVLSPYPTYPELSRYSNPRLSPRIDLPQRFGDRPFSRLDPGQSAIRLRHRGLVVGYSTETQRWGPQRINPILLSQHAGGFERVYLGTERPLNVRMGAVHVQWLWGRLTESAFFDTTAANGSRFLTGATASFLPKFAPGLEVGVSRAFMSAWRPGGPTVGQAVDVWRPVLKKSQADPTNPTGGDSTDQLASIFLRWVAPKAGFEVYGEWARGDHSWDVRDLLLSPEHASAFALGYQKTFRTSPRSFWHTGAELTILGAPRTTLVRSQGAGFFYYNSGRSFRQGYTQRGQILGAGIGPGSSQLSMDMARVSPKGRVGVSIQRTVFENDRYYRIFSSRSDFGRYEVEPAATVEALRFIGAAEIGGSISAGTLLNKYYMLKNDETNFQFALALRYRLGKPRAH